MMRVRNWDVRLVEWANDLVGQEYDWGRTDCGSLVERAHRLMFGKQIFPGMKYSTKREAVAIHARTGGVEGVLRKAGAVEIERNFVQQGDVFVEPDGDGMPSCAVVIAGGLLMTSPTDGVQLVPLALAGDGVFLRVPHG